MIKNFFKKHKIHSKIVPFLDLFFLLRPVGNFAIWVMLCIGMYVSQLVPHQFGKESELFITSFNLSTTLLFFGYALLMSSISMINQIKDKKSDKINKKLFLVNDRFDDQFVDKLRVIIGIISILILSYVNVFIMILGVLLYLFYGYLYNQDTLRFKRHPLKGLFCKIIVGIILIYSGYIHLNGVAQIFDLKLFLLFAPYILLFTSVSIMIDIPDYKGDQEDNVITFAAYSGRKTATYICLIINLLALIISLKIEDPLSSIIIITSLPFFMYAATRGLKKDILRAIRYPVSIINLFTMTIFPHLFLPVFIIFYLSKYYYWHRFSLHYPTLLVND